MRKGSSEVTYERDEVFDCGVEEDEIDFVETEFGRMDVNFRRFDAAESGMDDAITHVIEELRAGKGGKTLRAFLPIVLKYASYYAKIHGVPFEDLFQAGCLAVIEAEWRCSDTNWFARQMKQRMPQQVRRAARRLLPGGSGLGELEDILPESETWRRIREMEVRDMLRHAVSDTDLEVADALLVGYGQAEIAELLGVSQQVVGRRLARIRRKTRSLLFGDAKGTSVGESM